MYRRSMLAGAIAAMSTLSAAGANAQQFTADLKGFNEIGSIPTTVTVPTTPTTVTTTYTGAVLTDGAGTANLVLNKMAATVTYTLTYSNVGLTPPQTGTVSQAHIHFGKTRDSGGILVFFCTNVGVPPTFTGGTKVQACPANSGTVSGTWKAADVQAIPGQNVSAGDFNALVAALESETAYANVHTIPHYAGGEIRGQVFPAQGQQGNQNQQ